MGAHAVGERAEERIGRRIERRSGTGTRSNPCRRGRALRPRLASGLGSFALLLAGALVAAPPAAAAPLVGDETSILVTADLSPLSLTLGGSASTDALGRLVLPVTGGDVEIPLLTGTIEHVGSSLTLALGGASLELADLLIDLTDAVVRGSLTFRQGGDTLFSGPLALFDSRLCFLSTGFDPCLDGDGSTLLNGVGLNVTESLALFVDDAFGIGDVTGGPFGVAFLDIRFASVPEPSSAALLALAGLAALSRRTTRVEAGR
jgi:hypothetical protein